MIDNMKASQPIWGHAAAFFTILVWGITFISTKVLLDSFTPLEITFFRLLMAVLALLIVRPPKFPFNIKDRLLLKSEWKSMFAGLCGVTLYFIFQNIALTHTLAANVGVLISVAPLFIALISHILRKDKLKGYFFIGFAAALLGIVLISYNGNFVLQLNPLGDFLSILAAVVWALYSVTIESINAPQSGIYDVTRNVFIFGFLFLLPFLPFFEFRIGIMRFAELPNLINLLFLGVVASALCFVTWNFAVQVLGPVRTSLYIYLVPFITIVTSALYLHEPVTPISAIGMVLILVGMLISEREKSS